MSVSSCLSGAFSSLIPCSQGYPISDWAFRRCGQKRFGLLQFFAQGLQLATVHALAKPGSLFYSELPEYSCCYFSLCYLAAKEASIVELGIEPFKPVSCLFIAHLCPGFVDLIYWAKVKLV